MLYDIQYQMAESRREREREAAARSQLRQLKSPSIRRAIGRSIIAIGVRLAAEPQPRLARSR